MISPRLCLGLLPTYGESLRLTHPDELYPNRGLEMATSAIADVACQGLSGPFLAKGDMSSTARPADAGVND